MPSPADTICESVRGALRRLDLLEPTAPALVAVSGGPDSVALLYLLHEIGVPLEVAHLDHQTRQGRSALDEQFVQGLAALLDCPYHAMSRPIAEEAKTSPMSFEEYAREARYAFLVGTARTRGCCAIVTGHHADDQAETVLLRMLRGAGPRGLAGIASKSTRDGVTVARPLLGLTRTQILAYIEERGYSFRVDESNGDPGFVRNRVRHALLPHLRKDYNPLVDDALVRLASIQRVENEFMQEAAAGAFQECLTPRNEIERERFRALPLALKRRVILHWTWSLGVDCSYERAVALADFVATGPNGQHADAGKGVMLRNDRGATHVVREFVAEPGAEAVPLTAPGDTLAFGKRFAVRFMDGPAPRDMAASCSSTRQVFPRGILREDAVLRRPRDRDRIRPLGMTGSKSVKKYFDGVGIPGSLRQDQIVLAAGDEVLWVVGHGIAAGAAVDPADTNLAVIEVADETA